MSRLLVPISYRARWILAHSRWTHEAVIVIQHKQTQNKRIYESCCTVYQCSLPLKRAHMLWSCAETPKVQSEMTRTAYSLLYFRPITHDHKLHYTYWSYRNYFPYLDLLPGSDRTLIETGESVYRKQIFSENFSKKQLYLLQICSGC